MSRIGVPPLTDYRFVAVAASATVHGVLLDSYGRPVQLASGDWGFTYVVDSTTFRSVGDLIGGDVPDEAVACAIRSTSADLVITSLGRNGSAPDLTEAKTQFPYHPAGSMQILLGMVAS